MFEQPHRRDDMCLERRYDDDALRSTQHRNLNLSPEIKLNMDRL